MLKILDSRFHGALDYLLGTAFIVAPAALELAYPAEPLAYISGGVYLGMTLFTRYAPGMLELIPYPIHGLIEALLAGCWIGMPWLFEFAHDALARNLYVGAGAGLLAAVLLTDYRSPRAPAWHRPERRHALVDRRQRALSRGPHSAERRAGPRDRRRYAVA